MRIAALVALLLACKEEGKPEPRAVPVTLEPARAADAAIAAVGAQLTPSAPLLSLAAIRPHLAPLAGDCKAGSDLACTVFANLYRYGALVARKAPAEEVAGLDEACGADKDPAACALAGEARHDQAKARQAGDLFQLACSQGIAEGCAIGDDLAALTRACDLGDFASCETLVGRAGIEAGSRIARGLAIFEAACQRKHPPSCDAASTLAGRLSGSR